MVVVVVVVLTTTELFKKIKKVNVFGTHCITNISMDMRTFVRHSSRIMRGPFYDLTVLALK